MKKLLALLVMASLTAIGCNQSSSSQGTTKAPPAKEKVKDTPKDTTNTDPGMKVTPPDQKLPITPDKGAPDIVPPVEDKKDKGGPALPDPKDDPK